MITIEKAIDILETEAHLAERQPETGVYDAVKLGIEALNRVKEARIKGTIWNYSLLPGETKE